MNFNQQLRKGETFLVRDETRRKFWKGRDETFSKGTGRDQHFWDGTGRFFKGRDGTKKGSLLTLLLSVPFQETEQIEEFGSLSVVGISWKQSIPADSQSVPTDSLEAEISFILFL